ncbi:MAG: DUF4147 domain-containing protein [Fimbriimonadaceae bacterium]|nr:DUF4147 domain-containing protein [Fimbriimonadaceae bacterium]
MKVVAHPMSKAAELTLEIYRRTLEEVRGDRLIESQVWLEDGQLHIDDLDFDLDDYRRIVVAGAGKASVAMAQGLESILGSRISEGLIVAKDGHPDSLSHCRIIDAAHPIPDESSLEAGREMLALAARTQPDDLVLFCLSGGASALIESPVDGISLPDRQTVNRARLSSGATIAAVNAVRARLSRIKAGGLARAFAKPTVIVLYMSDVLGNDRQVIGSGPFFPPRRDANLGRLITAFDLKAKLPPQVLAKLIAVTNPTQAVAAPPHRSIGDARMMGHHAKHIASTMGLTVDGPSIMRGEAVDYVQRVAKKGAFGRCLQPRECFLSVGETVVTLHGDGLGGRAQEAACAIARELEGSHDVAVLFAGSDGSDGPTDASGALVDGQSARRANEKGWTVERALSANDSYHFHEAADSLVKTGPTGSNLNDIMIVVRV